MPIDQPPEYENPWTEIRDAAGNSVSVPSTNPPIREAQRRVAAALNDLSNLLDVLYAAIDPVLRPAEQGEDVAQVQPRPLCGEVANGLLETAERIETLSRGVVRVSDRLEL